MEDRHIVVADVTSAYLNADMDDFVLIQLSGDDVDMMCNANPAYEKFITKNNGAENFIFAAQKGTIWVCKERLTMVPSIS